jgi:hypothetical protein
MKRPLSIAFLVLTLTCGSAQSAPPTTSQQLGGNEGPRVVRGAIEEFRSFKLNEVAEPQLLAKVRTSDGDVIVASIGSANTFGAGRVARGTQIGMLGQTGSINGKEVFFAQRVDLQPPAVAKPTTAATKPADQ